MSEPYPLRSAEEDEPEMLPKARRELPEQELIELGRKFEKAKEAAG